MTSADETLGAAMRQAFLKQARSDFILCQELRNTRNPTCHWVHYLQLATEKLARAYEMDITSNRRPAKTHAAFASFVRTSLQSSAWQKSLGYGNRTARYKALLKRLRPLAELTEKIAPSFAGFDRPNPEYPWQDSGSRVIAPVEHHFSDFTTAGPLVPELFHLVKCILDRDLPPL